VNTINLHTISHHFQVTADRWFLSYLLQTWANSDKIWYSDWTTFTTKYCKLFPPHPNTVSTLPCETWS